jgi:hypothetical protein
MLAAGSEFVNWRSWLLAASTPWTYPTQTQLLDILDNFKAIDLDNLGYISRRAFLKVTII